MKLVIVRHGNTFNKGDTILRVGARTDLPLTEEGLRQCRDIGTALKARGWLPDIVFCAPLKRTRQSAEQLLQGLGTDTPCTVADFLTELDYGEDDGMPEDAVTLRLGRSASPHAAHSDEELRALGKQVLKRWDDEFVLPEGWAHLRVRIGKLRDAWKEFGEALVRGTTPVFFNEELRMKNEEFKNIVVAVTSNGVARFATTLLPLGARVPADSLKLGTGRFAVFEHDGTQWACTEWNVSR